MRTSPVWSPVQYGTYADERAGPFRDLVERVQATDVRTVVDLGCDLLQGYLIARPAPPFSDPL
jgi:trans-aconitate methyltransferase